jgi:hypothetical protein
MGRETPTLFVCFRSRVAVPGAGGKVYGIWEVVYRKGVMVDYGRRAFGWVGRRRGDRGRGKGEREKWRYSRDVGGGYLGSWLRGFWGDRDQVDREMGDEIMCLVEPEFPFLAFLQYTTCAEMLRTAPLRFRTFIHRLEILICTKCSASSFLPCMSSGYPKHFSPSLRARFGLVVAAYRSMTPRQVSSTSYFDGM